MTNRPDPALAAGGTGLTCYALHDFAPRIVPGRAGRRWMDEFPDPAIYRCLPLAIANAYGWDILCPVPIEIHWNGGPTVADLEIRALKPLPGGGPVDYFCASHFSSGIVTLHVDWIFRTDPGWNLLITGPFNAPKDNAAPLSAIIDSDRLSYPFSMNWQMLRPGRVRLEEDEPFCSLVPVRPETVANCVPEFRRLADAPEIQRQYEALRVARERDRRDESHIAPDRQ